MEIRVSQDGEVVLNVDNGETERALHFVRALQKEAKEKKVSETRSQSHREANVKGEQYGELNQLQYRTWEYLTENDNPDGIHISQIARAFGISVAAANTRAITLHKLGYAKRIHKGYYRALCGPEAE